MKELSPKTQRYFSLLQTYLVDIEEVSIIDERGTNERG